MSFYLIQKPETGGRVIIWDKRTSPAKIVRVLPDSVIIAPNQTETGVLFWARGEAGFEILTDSVTETQLEPDAEQSFTGSTNALINLLQEQFFYKCCSTSEMAQLWKATGNTLEPTTGTNTVKVANAGFNIEPVLLLNNRPNNTGNTPQVVLEIDALPTGAPNIAKYQKIVAAFDLKAGDSLTIFKIPMAGLAAYGDLKIMSLQEGTPGFCNWQHTFSYETLGGNFTPEDRNKQTTFGSMDISYDFPTGELHINITNNSGVDTNSIVTLDLSLRSIVA